MKPSMYRIALKRLDDLRMAETGRVNELMELRDEHYKELRLAEAKRLDAIRLVDVNALSVANERSVQQAAILATQVASSAEMLRLLVASTAATQAQQLSQMVDRIALLEKSQYLSKGTSGGMRDMYGWITAGVLMLINVVGVAYAFMHK
jgi:hypothetical protein